jgi:hypothetical protein
VAVKKAPVKAKKVVAVKKVVKAHKFIKGVNPKKSLTLYNGFLGFKNPKASKTIVNNVLKEYWNGSKGKTGCKGRNCHKLRIDATRSCD